MLETESGKIVGPAVNDDSAVPDSFCRADGVVILLCNLSQE